MRVFVREKYYTYDDFIRAINIQDNKIYEAAFNDFFSKVTDRYSRI